MSYRNEESIKDERIQTIQHVIKNLCDERTCWVRYANTAAAIAMQKI